MNIKQYWLWEMPEKLEGTVFIIDAFAATTNIALFLSKSVQNLVIANDHSVELAKDSYPDALLIGESNTIEKNQFYLGNSPKRIEKTDITGRNIIYMSINGTRAIEKSIKVGATNVYTLCYVNFGIAVHYAKTLNEKITVIMSGDEGTETVEDIFCFQSFVKVYNNEIIDKEEVKYKVSEFMKSFYGVPRSDDTTKLVLSWNKYPVLPLCKQKSDGLIEVIDKA